MKRSTLAGSVAACICLSLSVPLLAAPTEKKVVAVKPAEKCLSDLRAFDNQMEKEGYWLGGSGDGFGYPMEGYGLYGPPLMDQRVEATGIGYQNARPGYELRTLIASANILARQGQQQACEDVLATTRDIYKVYVADLHSGKMPMADVQGWRQLQIAAAQPVTSTNTSFRSDELVGTEVRSPQNEALGSVEDLVMSPQTGKIAYLVIAEGEFSGLTKNTFQYPGRPSRYLRT